MNRPILLDTCAAIWLTDGQLSEKALAAIEDRHTDGAPTLLSLITAWEIGLLFSKGRLRSPLNAKEYFRRLSELPEIKTTPLSSEILIAASFLPGPALRDPVDRIIVATARDMGFTVMTRDAAILEYAKAGYLHALPC
jgi:PIN domain nuclease of toxin-antitoxin system